MSLWDSLSPGWQSALAGQKSAIDEAQTRLDALVCAGVRIAPDLPQVFAALPESPEQVQVVIIGQDPYPQAGHATGLAFSVPAGTVPLPPTLRNILRELSSDCPGSTAAAGDLSHWREQGVLLLNPILTTQVGESLAHQYFGWQAITATIIAAVRARNDQVIGVLWGNQAQKLEQHFRGDRVIKSVHPSPLSAYRGFFGSKPFTKANTMLSQSGSPAINW
jgi:uracil-DNA glycosylase